MVGYVLGDAIGAVIAVCLISWSAACPAGPNRRRPRRRAFRLSPGWARLTPLSGTGSGQSGIRLACAPRGPSLKAPESRVAGGKLEMAAMIAPRTIQLLVLACALGAGIAACSGSSNNSGLGAARHRSVDVGASPRRPPAADPPPRTITANWDHVLQREDPGRPAGRPAAERASSSPRSSRRRPVRPRRHGDAPK